MYNTQHGNLPGHRRKAEDEKEAAPRYGTDGLLFRSEDFLAYRHSSGAFD